MNGSTLGTDSRTHGIMPVSYLVVWGGKLNCQLSYTALDFLKVVILFAAGN